MRIEGVGLCHTDLVFASGAMEDYPFPAVLGHEGSGEVVSVGAKVSKVAPGDKVLITFRSCGACDGCENPRVCSDHSGRANGRAPQAGRRLWRDAHHRTGRGQVLLRSRARDRSARGR
ncbi:alcohol dehydrogenase catalytic domain-containing protein [Ponticaulis profundi]|uniref:Alcohol dehydrogenase catalytic domain-containing protein n=1 Tax=Ponticaulis profundi TaxID=2665222 RepID=A0ABW1S6X8_9PROT